MNESIKKNSLNFGFFLGTLLIVPALLGYVIDTIFIVSYWSSIIQFIGIVALGVFCIIHSRRILGGFISLKEAFSSHFSMLVVGFSISSLFNIMLFNFIDVNFVTKIIDAYEQEILSQKERLIELTKDQNQEQLKETLGEFDSAIEILKLGNHFSIISMLKSWLVQVAFYAFFGLISARFLRREPPMQQS